MSLSFSCKNLFKFLNFTCILSFPQLSVTFDIKPDSFLEHFLLLYAVSSEVPNTFRLDSFNGFGSC